MVLEGELTESGPSMAAATSAPPVQHKQAQELKQQVKEFTAQVALGERASLMM